MSRPREFDEDTVLDALRDVFWENGYEGTSYADIMSATGLKKGSLYAAFGDKQSLYQYAIARYDSQNVSAGVKMLSDKSVSAETRIKSLFDILINGAGTKEGRWGCLLCNAAADQAPINSDVEDSVQSSMNRLKTAIGNCLTNLGPDDKTELIWTLYFGARTLIKAGYDKAVLRSLKAQAMQVLAIK